MLLSNASRGALREKGIDDDEERVSEPLSSCQNGDEPYPQGTWAHQMGLSCVCDAQMGMGNRMACDRGCQT